MPDWCDDAILARDESIEGVTRRSGAGLVRKGDGRRDVIVRHFRSRKPGGEVVDDATVLTLPWVRFAANKIKCFGLSGHRLTKNL